VRHAHLLGIDLRLFSKIKNLLRKVAVRSKEALEEAMGLALLAVSSEDARGYFEHAGYRTPAQQL
jgi:hypothetical protein